MGSHRARPIPILMALRAERDARILKLHREGVRMHQIAIRFGMSRGGIARIIHSQRKNTS